MVEASIFPVYINMLTVFSSKLTHEETAHFTGLSIHELKNLST